MSSSIDYNKINSLISQFQETIECDEICQKKKEAEALKKKLEDAKSTLFSAPAMIESAEKLYITFTEGEAAYNDFEKKKLLEKADEIINTFKKKVSETTKNIQNQLSTYNGILINYQNVADLYKKYKEENEEITKKFKNSTNDILTNERKTYYQDQEVDTLAFYYYYIILIIYIICVICFGFFSILYPSNSTWIMRITIIIGLILLPYFSTWILGVIIYIVHEIYYMLPKNVYKRDFDENINYNQFKNI